MCQDDVIYEYIGQVVHEFIAKDTLVKTLCETKSSREGQLLLSTWNYQIYLEADLPWESI
jgi:hypothetical protein